LNTLRVSEPRRPGYKQVTNEANAARCRLQASSGYLVTNINGRPGHHPALLLGVDKVKNLPLGAFLAYNRESGAELAGRVF